MVITIQKKVNFGIIFDMVSLGLVKAYSFVFNGMWFLIIVFSVYDCIILHSSVKKGNYNLGKLHLFFGKIALWILYFYMYRFLYWY